MEHDPLQHPQLQSSELDDYTEQLKKKIEAEISTKFEKDVELNLSENKDLLVQIKDFDFSRFTLGGSGKPCPKCGGTGRISDEKPIIIEPDDSL